MIEIIGYDMYTGTRTTPKRFKRRFVANKTELEKERDKIRRRQQRKCKDPVEIYLSYRQFDDRCE